MPEQTRNQQLTRNSSDRKSFLQRDGLGRRIVVEDEDELPSRILDTSGSTFMSMTTTTSPKPVHDEDEEENNYIEQDRRSRPSTNTGAGDRKSLRVSSPSVLEGASDEVQGSKRAAEVEEKDEEQEEMGENASSPIIPTAPPLNTSTPNPSQRQSSSSSLPHTAAPLTRLSSASGTTIRIDSPPIDLRPPLALSDIREPGGPLIPGSKKRQSLFLPHPNAPKSVGGATATDLVGPGAGVPMYIASQQPQGVGSRGSPKYDDTTSTTERGWSYKNGLDYSATCWDGHGSRTIRTSRTGQRPPLMIPMRGPTIYGRTEIDLADSMGPVPIVFSIDPPPRPIVFRSHRSTLNTEAGAAGDQFQHMEEPERQFKS